MTAREVITSVAKETTEVLLFHSATGKDSIVLLDMLAKHFKRVVCCLLYFIKDCELEDKYIRWAEKKYPNCKFIKYPHYDLSKIVKYGGLGVKANPKQKIYSLADLMNTAKEETGIEWACRGIKKYDSLERRIMLNDMKIPINYKTKNFYPLAEWTNKDCEKYILDNKLPKNVKTDKNRTQGFQIMEGSFLLYLKKYYPNDLQKVLTQFPLTKVYLYEAEQAALQNK